MTLPLVTHVKQYTFGKGKLYVGLFGDDGNPVGERYLGNCPGFGLTVATTKFEHNSSTEASAKKDLSVVTGVNFNATINTDDMTPENTALFLGGTVSTITVSATPVTAEMHTVATGYEYQVGATNTGESSIGITSAVASITVKDSAGTTTYVLNTDYKTDPATGRIYIMPTGAIDDGDIVQFGYTPVAGTKTRVTTTSTGSVYGSVRFVADNTFGVNNNLFISSASLSGTGDRPFITDNALAAFAIDVGINEKDSATPQVIIDSPLAA
jgi:hypothetical protein